MPGPLVQEVQWLMDRKNCRKYLKLIWCNRHSILSSFTSKTCFCLAAFLQRGLSMFIFLLEHGLCCLFMLTGRSYFYLIAGRSLQEPRWITCQGEHVTVFGREFRLDFYCRHVIKCDKFTVSSSHPGESFEPIIWIWSETWENLDSDVTRYHTQTSRLGATRVYIKWAVMSGASMNGRVWKQTSDMSLVSVHILPCWSIVLLVIIQDIKTVAALYCACIKNKMKFTKHLKASSNTSLA